MKKRSLSLAALFLPLILPVGLLAAQLPSHYPDHFDNVGIIDDIDARQSRIVIYDTLMRLPAGVAVHSPSRQVGLVSELRKGMKVGYSYRRENRSKNLTDIWILPGNYPLGGDE
ncbi:hypothetical protein Tel_00860 [Candidatus Tenderia electrophaga]|jgi:hypothetical protein|uniref:Uncharacterized protein n=1 Tax=Candidatus Tenderia electrophaga TaxID=1748243 RepID=A0A0S2T9F7_9GAMM|nr:hypothetical protein Tel_00860 [Candidatus Tenderia electrophaga]